METNKNIGWEKTCDRYVAFFDIMGFKEFVTRNTHETVMNKLIELKKIANSSMALNHSEPLERINLHEAETRSVSFSDSIIIFSKGDSIEDAVKILLDAALILGTALDLQIPMKGAFSYGKITVDFDSSLFFGQPIIDAYNLEEELQLYAGVLDHHFENKLHILSSKDSSQNERFKLLLVENKIHLKSGIVNHKVLKICEDSVLNEQIISIKNFYNTVSGSPRKYVDNTLDFFSKLLPKV